MQKTALLLCALFIGVTALAQPAFNLAGVPDSLKKGASIIVHQEKIDLEVAGLDKATVKVQKLFTVLDEDGKEALFFNEYSTKFASLDEAEIRVYDASGKVAFKHKKKEMTTTAVGEGLIEDGNLTYFRVQPTAYPVTVEFLYEVKLKSTFALPDYRFISSGEAVVQSSFTARVPADLKLRYKARHCNVEPVVADDGKTVVYRWAVANLKPVEDEEGSLARRDLFPHVQIVSDQFSHYGYRGDLATWKSFGAWIRDLYLDRDELPPARRQFFQNMVSTAGSEAEKIRRIYRYLQENFRYVSIQLGIGGLQPFSAQFTDEKKYGDCKGLSNYMKAALKAVGIRSHVAVINAGYNEAPVDAAFPANGFNHVVLCVPAKDSVWLECTSATAEFNKLGAFTENRHALLITEEGGVLVPTPRSEAGANAIHTRTVVAIDNTLAAASETALHTTGEYSEMISDMLKEPRDEQKKTLVFYLGYKQPDNFELGGGDGPQTSLKMSHRKLHEFNAGSKYFFNPRMHKIWSGRLPSADGRRQDYYFRYPFIKQDTTVLTFPEGFVPDVLPAEKKLETDYGTYRSKTWFNEKEKAFYTATSLVLKRHKILAQDYPKVKAFFDEVVQDDTQKIVVKRTEAAAATEKKAF